MVLLRQCCSEQYGRHPVGRGCIIDNSAGTWARGSVTERRGAYIEVQDRTLAYRAGIEMPYGMIGRQSSQWTWTLD